MPRIKNLNQTANKTCNCNSWIDHWKNYSGSFLFGCSTVNCHNSDLVGAHVKKVGSDNKYYIIPLCRACNNKTEEFSVGFFTSFAPANVATTCGA